MEEGEIEETQQQHEPLFKPLTDSCQQEGAKAPNPKYEDGRVLPRKLRSRFLQEAKPCVPLEEIDPYFRNKQTFVVIGRWGTIHRFSCNAEGYLTLGPNNVFRRLAIYLQTNWIFSTLIVATLLLNIVALVKTQNYQIMRGIDYTYKKSWVVDTMYIVDYICLAIYCFELGVKVIARGFMGDAFTCFRDPWSWLDVLVIWTGFFYYHSFILTRRAAVWIRIFKIIPLVPSIRQAGRLSLRVVKQLGGMLILLVFLLWFFALLGCQLYMGTLTQVCIKQIPDGVAISDEMWAKHNRNMTNWYKDDFDFALCGNSSGSRQCPDNYVCLQGFGNNPDLGYTNFDNVLWSLLSVIRIGTEDFTEDIFRKLLSTNGPQHILFFEAIFFLITLPMGCLFFALLGNFFTESKAPSELEIEELTGLAEVHDFDPGQNPEALVIKGKTVDPPGEEDIGGFRKALYSFMYHEWIRNILICVIILDILGIVSDYYGIQTHAFDYRLYILAIPYLVFFIYTLEFLLKIIALGIGKYFRNRWNHLDLIVLLTFFLEIQSYFGQYTGYMLAPIRLLKLVQYWPSLRMIFSIYYKTIKSLWGWVLYSFIVFGFFVFIGPFEIGQSQTDMFRGRTKFTANDLPRWSFIDFWHSFRNIVRMQIAEWVETFWVTFRYAGANTVWYYLAVNTCGALLISFLLVGVVYTTIGELNSRYDPSKDKGLRLLLRKAFGLVYFPIQRIQPRELVMKNGSDSLAAENGADESETKAKPDGKEGERRKKSIVAESTSQLRKVMQDCTEHWAYKIVCAGMIIIASLAMILETKESGEDMQIALFVIEILFTIAFFVVAVYELLSYGFKESVMNRGWLFDALIVLENILNLSIYQFSVTGSFRVGVFCIRSFRPLMLIARVDWLKAPFRGIKYELKLVWETILAILFVWLLFATFGVHWLKGLYYKCIDPNTGDEVFPTLNRVDCLAKNHSWENSELNFDNSGDGFLNMVFLVSRMGWVAIINDGSDAVGHDLPRQTDISKFWLIYFIVFILCGGLGALGILFSYVFKKFQEDHGYEIILTENQANTYTEGKTSKEPRPTWITLEDEYIPTPDNPCLLSLYNLVTNKKFDGLIMLVIILDNVCLSLDHYMLSSQFEMVLRYVSVVILLLFIVEMIVKLVCWGQHYFRNAWNYLDLAVILTSFIGLIIQDIISMYFINPGLIRMLRLLRIFRFLLAKKCGSQTAKVFLSSIINIRPAFVNLLLLQLTIMWAFALLGMYLFGNVVDNGGLDHEINFRTFRSSFWTLALLLGFPCLDGIYIGLSNEQDCSVKDPETSTCGDKTSAILYIGLYAGLTFLVLLNMYAVLITEIISELGRLKKEGKCGASEEDVPLQDVTTDNGTPNASNGEISEVGEDGEAEPEPE